MAWVNSTRIPQLVRPSRQRRQLRPKPLSEIKSELPCPTEPGMRAAYWQEESRHAYRFEV